MSTREAGDVASGSEGRLSVAGIVVNRGSRAKTSGIQQEVTALRSLSSDRNREEDVQRAREVAKKRARVMAELEELFKKPTWQRLAIWLSYQGARNVTGASLERRAPNDAAVPLAHPTQTRASRRSLKLMDHLMGSVYDHISGYLGALVVAPKRGPAAATFPPIGCPLHGTILRAASDCFLPLLFGRCEEDTATILPRRGRRRMPMDYRAHEQVCGELGVRL